MKKKTIVMMVLCLCACFGSQLFAQSIDPVSLVIAKVIKAIDLKVQRLQNETLVLQVAQQTAEQELGKQKLSEISNWQQELVKLYEGYYSELKMAKASIVGGALVKRIVDLQQQVLTEYGRLGKDASVKPQYDAMLSASMAIMQTLQMVLGSRLSMKDAERLCVLQTLRDAMQHSLETLRSLNKRQQEIIVNKTRLQADLDYVKRLHGLP